MTLDICWDTGKMHKVSLMIFDSGLSVSYFIRVFLISLFLSIRFYIFFQRNIPCHNRDSLEMHSQVTAHNITVEPLHNSLLERLAKAAEQLIEPADSETKMDTKQVSDEPVIQCHLICF